jgi:hypothetical protein
MQVYNPNNPVYKYKSTKTNTPKYNHVEQNKEVKEIEKLPNSYGLYVKPPLFDMGKQKASTYLQYVAFTIDTNDRDYSKYPNPFSFVSDRFTEYFENVKIFQIFYISLPQLNLVKLPLNQDSTYVFMKSFISTNTISNNQVIIGNSRTYSICNCYGNEVNFIIDGNISLVYCINRNNTNYVTYGFSNSYKLNANPYLRLDIPEVLYSPVLATDNKKFTYFVRMSRARNSIAYASVRAPTKVYKEQNLLNFSKLTFKFYDSTHQPLSVNHLDKFADPIDNPSSVSSKYTYIRHPLFYYHQIIMGIRIGVIRNMLK